MFKRISFLLIFALLSISFVIAENDFGYNNLGVPQLQPPINYSALNSSTAEYLHTEEGLIDNIDDILHNDLGGLQGGQATEYYHLKSAEHSELTTLLLAGIITNNSQQWNLSINSTAVSQFGGLTTSGTYNDLSIISGEDWIYLSGDGSVEGGFDIAIPKYANRNFYYGYGGMEDHYFGSVAQLIIYNNGNLITTGNLKGATITSQDSFLEIRKTGETTLIYAPMSSDVASISVLSIDDVLLEFKNSRVGSFMNVNIDGDLTAGRNVNIDGDNKKLFLGDGQDVSIYYNASDMLINPKEVGSGKLYILGDLVSNTTGASFGDNIYMPLGNITAYNITAINDLSVGGDISTGEKIIHTGDANTYISFADDSFEFRAGGIRFLLVTELANPTLQDNINLGSGSNDVDVIITKNGGTNAMVFDWDLDKFIFSSPIESTEDIITTGNLSYPAIYCESSELIDQDFAVAGKRYRINITNVDEGYGVGMVTGVNGTNITILQDGVYRMIAQPQVKAGAGGAGDFHMWIEKSPLGDVFSDVPNSNVELKLASLEEDVIVLATTMKLNQGDVIRFVVSVSDNKIQLHAQSPAGEPVIPSIIFTMNKGGN